MESEKLQILVTKYLNGEISESEMAALSIARSKDPDLDAHLRLHDDVDNKLGDSDLKDFESFLNASKPIKEVAVTPSTKKPVWLVAASITVILMISSLVFWYSGISADREDIYQAHFKPFPAINAYRNDTKLPGEDEGMIAYRAGDYERAARLIDLSNATSYEPGFYAGISHMVIADYEEALLSFSASGKFIEKDHPLYEEILWYEALCHLQLNNHEKMKDLLNEIITREGKRSFQADAILDLTGEK